VKEKKVFTNSSEIRFEDKETHIEVKSVLSGPRLGRENKFLYLLLLI
jgi:hypothetical protein